MSDSIQLGVFVPPQTRPVALDRVPATDRPPWPARRSSAQRLPRAAGLDEGARRRLGAYGRYALAAAKLLSGLGDDGEGGIRNAAHYPLAGGTFGCPRCGVAP
jgi:hypothetical protein